jgi:hypothetical protein
VNLSVVHGADALHGDGVQVERVILDTVVTRLINVSFAQCGPCVQPATMSVKDEAWAHDAYIRTVVRASIRGQLEHKEADVRNVLT